MPRQKHVVLRDRSTEVVELVQKLIDSGMPLEEIAAGAHVSIRTVYRWLNEGRAPHPSFLEALKKIGAKNAHQAGAR